VKFECGYMPVGMSMAMCLVGMIVCNILKYDCVCVIFPTKLSF